MENERHQPTESELADELAAWEAASDDDWEAGEVEGFTLEEFDRIAKHLRESGQASM